jgi:uncharacterized protein DUF1937
VSTQIASITESTNAQFERMHQEIGDAEALLIGIRSQQKILEQQNTGLRKQLVEEHESYLRRDMQLLSDLGLYWSPVLTMPEVIKTAWEMKGAREGRLIYLASPYSHPEEHIKQSRYEMVMEATAYLLADGHFIYSPILNSHPIASRCGIPGEWNHWRAFDTVMISRCDELWVLDIEGWISSEGVQAEIQIAQRRNIPSYLLDRKNGSWTRGLPLF